MRAMRLHSPAGLDRLELVDLADPPAPGPGEVRSHATPTPPARYGFERVP